MLRNPVSVYVITNLESLDLLKSPKNKNVLRIFDIFENELLSNVFERN